jgi:hypothetical protein
MAIDLYEYGEGYKQLKKHFGHKIVIADYAGKNMSIECETCGEVLVSCDKPKGKLEKGCYCTACGYKYKKKDIGGGRCTNCGTMIY